MIGCWLVFFTDEVWARALLRRLRSDLSPSRVRLRGLFGPPEVPRDAIAQLAERNVLPYEGDRIVGAGHPESVRTITIAVDRSAPNTDARHFDAHELLDYIADHVELQGRDQRPTYGIRYLDVTLVLAVHASTWERHEATMTRDQINASADYAQTSAPERAYVRSMATTWDGQVVVSVYVHVALEGRYLRVSVLPHVLPPIRNELRIVDVIETYHPLRHAAYAAIDATMELRRIGGRIQQFGRRWDDARTKRRTRREHQRTELVSVREEYAQGDSDHLQQRQDAWRIIDVIQTRVFDVAGRFLTDHGVDTAEFAAQAQVIIQHSVFIAGDANAPVQNVTGQGASATNTQAPQQGGNR